MSLAGVFSTADDLVTRLVTRVYDVRDLLAGRLGGLGDTARSRPEAVEELTLIPFGCTNLRLTEFPVALRAKV